MMHVPSLTNPLTWAAFGGIGIFVAALVDSSFVPLPLVTDLVLMELCSRHPLRVPYYSAMAAAGSLAGCIWIYWLARKGGEAYYRKHQATAPGRVRRFVQKYPMASVLLPAVAPFPVPFKPFVVAQGVFQVPFSIFVIGTLIGRGCLFFSEGFLGARYGPVAKEFIVNQKGTSAAIAIALGLTIFLIYRAPIFRRREYSQTD